MGLFATWVYADGWAHASPGTEPSAPEPWLWLSIHDSDFVTVRYAPSGDATGTAYLGFTPRTYWEDETASEPTDTAREALGLARWWAARTPGQVEVEAKAAELRELLAEDLGPDEVELDLSEEDIFVERRTERFLRALGLPLPEDLDEVEL